MPHPGHGGLYWVGGMSVAISRVLANSACRTACRLIVPPPVSAQDRALPLTSFSEMLGLADDWCGKRSMSAPMAAPAKPDCAPAGTLRIQNAAAASSTLTVDLLITGHPLNSSAHAQ